MVYTQSIIVSSKNDEDFSYENLLNDDDIVEDEGVKMLTDFTTWTA